MITTKKLSDGVTLRCFTDHRFKQNCLSLQFLRPMCREEAAKNALIPSVLLRGCQSAPDLRQITRRLDDLYGASVGPLVRQLGDYQSVGLYCSFISDDYALSGDRILAPMVAFLQELLLCPVVKDGVFLPEFVESEKKNQISALEAQKNDKRSYAVQQMLKNMCKADAYGISRVGEIEDVAAIDPQTLYAQYRKLLEESSVELFYVGETSPEEMEKLLLPLTEQLAENARVLPQQTGFRDGGAGEYLKKMDVAQARLCIGYTSPITIRDEDFPAMQVLNMVLGGGMTSKLFMNVREKLSLCYDVSSGFRSSKGLMLITAGVETGKLELAQEEIFRQVDACKNGDITPQELVAAKQGIITALQGVHDSPGGIEDYYTTILLTQAKWLPEEYLQAVAEVTAEDVARVAGTLSLHTKYILRGDA